MNKCMCTVDGQRQSASVMRHDGVMADVVHAYAGIESIGSCTEGA